MAGEELGCASLVRDGAQLSVYTEASTPAINTSDRYLVENNGKMSIFVETGDDPTEVTGGHTAHV